MRIKEYLWKHKKSLRSLAEAIEISPNALSLINNEKVIPRLDTALKLFYYTNGEIGLNDLLAPKELRKIKKNAAVKRAVEQHQIKKNVA